MTGLLDWLDRAPTGRGIRFARAGDGWDFWPYERLADRTRRVAAGLRAAGVGPGDVVCVAQRTGPDAVAALFGALLAGAAPAPIAPPVAFGDRVGYDGVFATARPAALVTDPGLASLFRLPPCPVWTVDRLVERAGARPPPAREPDGLALLQFTSGSSGRGKAVRVSWPALSANVAAIRRWLGMDGTAATASWLPLHHDMGLTGCLITPIVDGGDLWLLPPEEFVRRPLRYLRCFDAGARFTAMPNFGLDHVLRRVPGEALAGLDFSGWGALIVGAERIDPGILREFSERLGPYGFAPRTIRPAYGLAEATLAVTGLPMDETWSTLPGPVSPVVGCGRPLAGVTVGVVGDGGEPLPDGRIGEIVVRGASVADGYADGDFNGAVRTGDAGWLDGGQLYVLGRFGDSMKVRGRTVFAEDLESVLVNCGIPPLRLAVLLGASSAGAGGATGGVAVAVVEKAEPDWLVRAATALRIRVGEADVLVLDAPPKTIIRTSSGKPRRRELWRAFTEGRLPGRISRAPR